MPPVIPSPQPRSFVFYLALLACAPLPLGSNRDWAWPLLAAALLLLAGAVSFEPRALGHAGRRQLGLLLALAAWMLLQWFGLPPFIEPVTLDQAATRNALLKTLAYTAFVYLTLQLVDSARSAAWVIGSLLLGACAQSVLALAELITQSPDATLRSGLSASRASGTYASPNHLAGYLHQILSLALGLTLVQYRRALQPSAWKSVAAFLTGPGLRLRVLIVIAAAGLVMTLSRGGNLAFLTALIAATALAGFAARRFNRAIVILVATVVLIDIALIGQHYGLERLASRVRATEPTTELRYNLVPYHLAMLRDHVLTGAGAGSYESLFPKYRDAAIPGRLTHAENDYVQLLIELGIPGALCLGLFLELALRQQWRLLRAPPEADLHSLAFGSLLATLTMLLHSLVDFNLYIPANALLFLFALTVPFALTGASDRESPLVASPSSGHSLRG